MNRTSIVLDQKKLAKVRKILGTKGIKDTVDRAFDEVLALELRKRAVDRYLTMQGTDLADAEVMARAWR